MVAGPAVFAVTFEGASSAASTDIAEAIKANDAHKETCVFIG